jgi:hypothetical protein
MTVAPVSKTKQAARIDPHGVPPCNGPVSTLNATVSRMNNDALDDDALFLLARDGDQEAFAALVRRYQDRAYRWARRYAGGLLPDEDCFDIVQEVLFRIWWQITRHDDENTDNSNPDNSNKGET